MAAIEIDTGDLDRRDLAIRAAAIIGISAVLASVILVLMGGPAEVVAYDEETATASYSDGSVFVNNSGAVGDSGWAFDDNALILSDSDFHGYRIGGQISIHGFYNGTIREVVPAVERHVELGPNEPPTDFRPSPNLYPGNGIPEGYATLSLKTDADGEGYVHARIFFDEDYRQMVDGDASIRWGTALGQSRAFRWNELRDGIYMDEVRDYSIHRYELGANPREGYIVAGDIVTGAPWQTMDFRGSGIWLE